MQALISYSNASIITDVDRRSLLSIYKLTYTNDMAHKNTQEGEHDLTASAFIVLLENKPKGASVTRPQLVLHEHAELGKLLQFGGHLEDNETPWQAALRKAKQEGGFEADE